MSEPKPLSKRDRDMVRRRLNSGHLTSRYDLAWRAEDLERYEATVQDLEQQLTEERQQVELARGEERDAAAKVADEQHARSSGCRVCGGRGEACRGQADAAESIANAIRSRGTGGAK